MGRLRCGRLEDIEYTKKLISAGFAEIEIEPTRIYQAEDAREILSAEGMDIDAMAPQIKGKFMSAFVRATKPMTDPANRPADQVAATDRRA